MPSRIKKYNNKVRRKVHRRKYKNARSHQSRALSYQKAPLPNRFAAKLRYSATTSINPGAVGIAGVQVFSCNGIYDPDITGVGHQPRGFDQFMTMYDHFCVVGSKITVTFFHKYGLSYTNLLVGINLKDDTTVYTNSNDYMEGRNVITATMPCVTGGTAAGLATQRKLSKAFSTRKFLGRPNPTNSQYLLGSAASNPQEQAFYHVWCAPTVSAIDDEALGINVVIDYLVIFMEPRQPSQS